jgi:hypothetical protein
MFLSFIARDKIRYNKKIIKLLARHCMDSMKETSSVNLMSTEKGTFDLVSPRLILLGYGDRHS